MENKDADPNSSDRAKAFKTAQERLEKLKEANKTAAEMAENELARLRQIIRDRQKSSMVCSLTLFPAQRIAEGI